MLPVATPGLRSKFCPLQTAFCASRESLRGFPVSCSRAVLRRHDQARSQSPGERSDVILINDGDSLLNVNGSPMDGKTSLSFALPLLNGSVSAVNTSIPGETLAQMVDGFSNNVGRKYESKSRAFVVHSLGGGNDIRAGVSASEVYARLQAYVRSVHALGSNASRYCQHLSTPVRYFQSSTAQSRSPIIQ